MCKTIIFAGTRELTDAEYDQLFDLSYTGPVPAGLSQCVHCGMTVINEQEAERQRLTLEEADD